MAFRTTTYDSSFLHSAAAPKELLLVLKSLNEKQKVKLKQQKKQEMQQQQQQHYYQNQHHGQQQHKQHQPEESKSEDEQKQSQQHLELSQIELIYRAEGNANLVLALPQFKKVLRLPKISTQHEQIKLEQKAQCQEMIQRYQENSQQNEQPQEQRKQQNEINQQQPKKISTAGQQENKIDAVGILTMDHYVAYISIIRCLVGNEFVFEADIVAVPNPTDRLWINEHIKPYRPANRMDKEFGGHFGLLLPDATQLPAEFDSLFSNLQSPTVTTATKTSHCSNSSSNSSSNSTDNSCSMSNNIFGSDTYAIEIKPKQGWLLPNDVNNLFDIKPKTTQPSKLLETKNILKAAVATTIPATTTTTTESKTLNVSTDIAYFTASQNDPSQTIIPATEASASSTKTLQANITTTTTSRCCSGSTCSTRKTPKDDKTSHSLYDKVDIRCRYCCMQFLKLKQQNIVKRSQYCPMDLFSGNPDKMIFALKALFECPQNNLRIFHNGNLVFDEQISRTSQIGDLFSSDKLQLIKHLLVTCLLREYNNKGEAKNKEKYQINQKTKQQLLSTSASTVDDRRVRDGGGNRYGTSAGAGVAAGQPQSSVTSCKKQKSNTMLKSKTTETTTTILTETEVTKVKSTLTLAEPIFSNVTTLTSTSSDCSTWFLEQLNKAEVTCLPKNCVLQKILNLQSLAKINLQFMLDHEYADKKEKTYSIVHKLIEKFAKAPNGLTHCQLSPEEQYILAATALDCSIMITFCEIDNVLEDDEEKPKSSLIDNPFVVSIFGRTFLTKVTLLDLDPKPDSHFYKYSQQMKQIFDAVASI